MAEKSEQTSFEEDFVDFLTEVFSGLGLDQLSSRLVGMIFLEPEEVSMEDLAERTGYSLASLSNKLRTLESHHIIVRIKKPGTKKAYYYIEKDVYAIMRRKVQTIRERFIDPAKKTLPEILENAKKAKLSQGEKKKLDIIQNYHKQLLEVDQCVQKMQKELEKR